MPPEFKPIKFPEDESTHDAIVEWWYFNGHLHDANGKEYSFMDCLFKVDVKKVKIPFLSKIPLKTSYFSHSLVSNLEKKQWQSRIAPFSIVSDDSFSKPLLYINYINPEIKNGYNNCVISKINESEYEIKNEDIELHLTSTKKPLLVGGNAYLDLHPKTTYYYSLTNLKTEGRIKISGEWVNITGKSWMDHQWADAEYSRDRWDWFCLQFENDTEIVCCAYDDGKTATCFASISYSDNRQEYTEAVEITPLDKNWQSPKSKAVYPLVWQIKIPDKNIDVNIVAQNEDQEMLFGSINYFEGPIRAEGTFGGKKINGVGFMELVGYPSEYSNVKFIKDEIAKAVRNFAKIAKAGMHHKSVK